MEKQQMFRHSIVFRMTLLVCCATAVVLTVNSWLIYHASKQTLLIETQRAGQRMTADTAQDLELYIQQFANVPTVMAQRQIQVGKDPDSAITSFLAGVLKSQLLKS